MFLGFTHFPAPVLLGGRCGSGNFMGIFAFSDFRSLFPCSFLSSHPRPYFVVSVFLGPSATIQTASGHQPAWVWCANWVPADSSVLLSGKAQASEDTHLRLLPVLRVGILATLFSPGWGPLRRWIHEVGSVVRRKWPMSWLSSTIAIFLGKPNFCVVKPLYLEISKDYFRIPNAFFLKIRPLAFVTCWGNDNPNVKIFSRQNNLAVGDWVLIHIVCYLLVIT